MRKKFITTVIVISTIIICISLGYITLNLKNNNQNNTNNQNDQDNNVSGNNNENIEPVNNNDDIKQVVVNSKIGNELTAMLDVNQIYSTNLYNELEKNGMSEKYKRMFTFSKINFETEYSDMLRIAENYAGYFITVKDLETVMKEYFLDTSNITHGNLFDDEQSYDAQNNRYIILPMGFAGSDLYYVTEIPYKIEEKTDKYYVYMYRLYITRFTEDESESGVPKYVLYYDNERKLQAYETTEELMEDKDKQTSIINQAIDSSKISKDNLLKVVYEITKKGTKNLISNYNVIK